MKDNGKRKDEFYGRLSGLVFPIAFQQFMLSLVGASDAVMLGSLSQDALSAVSLAGQVMFVFNLFLAALTIGASMFAAQYWGKKDKDTVERILAFVLRFSLIISAVYFVLNLDEIIKLPAVYRHYKKYIWVKDLTTL